MSLVTLAQAAAHLRLDLDLEGSPQSAEVDELTMKRDQAEGIILDYLEFDNSGSPTEWEAEGDEPTVPPEVAAAVLLVLSALWDDRAGTGEGDYLKEGGPVHNLLRRRRPLAIV